MKEIIDEKKKLMSEYERVLDSLNDPNVRDKSLLIEEISNKLDNYLIKYGPILMNQPIQTLFNIFNKTEFNEHNLAYKLIKDKYDENGDLNIFILLRFIDGKRLKHEYLKESIEESSKRNNFIVNFDFSYIVELEKVIEQAKSNQNEQQNQINELMSYIRRLEERLSSFETRTQQIIADKEMLINNQGQIYQQRFNEIYNQIRINEESTASLTNENANEIHLINELDRKMRQIKDRFNELSARNEHQNGQFSEQKERFDQHMMVFEQTKKEMNDNIKYSSESVFCHYLYHCIKNNLQLNEVRLPEYPCSYVYLPISIEGPGILSYLKKAAADEFDRPFIVSLSSRDPYNLFLNNWESVFYSFIRGDFCIEITLKDSIEMTGFEITGDTCDLLKSYKIFIDDRIILEIEEDENMRDKHRVRYDIEMKTCKKFKLVQTGPNWNNSKNNVIKLKRIEFFTHDHPEGLFKYWNEQNIYKDPHLFPVKIDSNHVSVEKIHDLQSGTLISTSNLNNNFCEIKFLKGVVLIDGYRLKRKAKSDTLKGWKIVGQTMSNQEILITEFVDELESSDLLHVSAKDEIKNIEPIKSLRIIQKINNDDTLKYLKFYHFDIFGQYIALK